MIYDFFNTYGGLNTMSDNYVTGDNIYERELQNFFFQTLGMMSITHYGAIGDGRRDNYGPLQVAIDDANRRGLNYIYVPYGRYIYTGELLHEGSVTFVGNPHAKIINIRTGKEIPIGQFGSSLGIDTMRYDLHKMAKALGTYIDYTNEIDQGYYYVIDEDNKVAEKEKQWTANFIADAEVLYSRVKIKGECLDNSLYYVADEEGNVLYASPKGMRFTELTEVNVNIPFGAKRIVFNFSDTDKVIPEVWFLDITGNVDSYSKEEVDSMLAEKQNTLIAGEGITIDNDVISATGEISGTPFTTCPFPTTWGGTVEQQTDTGTTSLGTWTISTDANPIPETGTKISYAFDRDDTTLYKAKLYTTTSSAPGAGPRYIEIDLPSDVSIRPVEIYTKIYNVKVNEASYRPIIQGYNEEAAEWEDLYTITEIPSVDHHTVGIVAEVSTSNYYTKFRISNMYLPTSSYGSIYDFQIRSGYIIAPGGE